MLAVLTAMEASSLGVLLWGLLLSHPEYLLVSCDGTLIPLNVFPIIFYLLMWPHRYLKVVLTSLLCSPTGRLPRSWAFRSVILWGCPAAWTGGDSLMRWCASAFTTGGGTALGSPKPPLADHHHYRVSFSVSPLADSTPLGPLPLSVLSALLPLQVAWCSGSSSQLFLFCFWWDQLCLKEFVLQSDARTGFCFLVFMFCNLATTSKTALHNSGDTEFASWYL